MPSLQWPWLRAICSILSACTFTGMGVGVAHADVWAPAGKGADGRDINDICFVDSHHCWLVGAGGMIRHSTDGGVYWTHDDSRSTQAFTGVWGADLNNVWAVNTGSAAASYRDRLYHWNGSAWSVFPIPANAGSVWDVWGFSASEFWIRGTQGALEAIWKWNGSAWEGPFYPPSTVRPGTPWASDNAHHWLPSSTGVLVWDGGTGWVNTALAGNPINALSGSGAADVVGVAAGAIKRWNGVSWSSQAVAGSLKAVWCAGGRVAVGGNEIYEGILPNDWELKFTAGQNIQLTCVDGWGAGLPETNKMVGGTDGTLVRAEPTGWQISEQGARGGLFDIWGQDPNRVYAVGENGAIHHWNGSFWVGQASGTTQPLHGVWGMNGSNIWAVGDNGVIRYYDGFTWQPQVSNTTQVLNAVAGSAVNDVWAVGAGGTILHWNGSSWAAVPSGTTRALYAVASLSGTVAWAAGEQGTLLFWNGSSWTSQNSGVTSFLNDLHVIDGGSVWAAGSNGTVLTWNGTAWAKRTLPAAYANQHFSGVWAADASHVWVVGSALILHWNGTYWAADSFVSPQAGSLYDVWGASAGEVLVSGQTGLIYANTPAYDPLQAWRHGHFSVTGNTGPAADLADPDGDGVANLAEYALNRNPLGPDATALPQARVQGNQYVMEFTVPQPRLDLACQAEWSTTLAAGSWTRINNSGTPGAPRFSVPVGSSQRIFMRLVFSAP